MSRTTMADHRRWLTTNEAAERLGITERTLRKMALAGDITRYQVNDRFAYRYDLNEIDALLRVAPVGGGSK